MNCNFCGAPIEAGTGKMYIKRDGTVLYFESSKCQRNQVGLGRVNRNVPWTKAAVTAKALLAKGGAAKATATKTSKK